MGRFIDLTGKTFGSWDVLYRASNAYDFRGYPITRWACRCLQCGEVRDVRTNSLRVGSSKSCGCYQPKPRGKQNPTFLDRTGVRYGRLLVLGYNDARSQEYGRAVWDCICDCGNTYTTSGDHLTDGHVRSCGCLQREVARDTNKGALSPRWNGGITGVRKAIRNLPEYRAWKLVVFGRDGYVCQHASCRKKRNIEAHHIVGLYTLLAEHQIHSSEDAVGCSALWDISNGVTVCKECHTALHTLFGRKGHDVEKAQEWLYCDYREVGYGN